jgi:RimJ/RimL family protein N-acetyltransferase
LRLLNEPTFVRYIADKGVRTLADAENYLLAGPMASYADFGYGLYHFTETASDRPAGMCGLIKRHDQEYADIGFAFLPEYQSRGFAFESAQAVLQYGQSTLDLGTIDAFVNPGNQRSIQLLERLGLQFEEMTRVAGIADLQQRYRARGPLRRAMSRIADSVTIRPARPQEANVLSALALESKAYWGYSDEFMRAVRQELTYSEPMISDQRYDFRVCESDDTLCGFYALQRHAAGDFELEALFVLPRYIGKGIGRRLLQHANEAVAAAGGQRLVIQGDPHANRFYLQAGARRIGSRESDSIAGRELPLYEMATDQTVQGRRFKEHT